MTTHVGLLRAVNLAGRNTVRSAQLRDFLTGLGLRDVRLLLQSGNMVFRSEGMPPAVLERRVEAAAVTGLGFETSCFVRTAAEWQRLVAANPFTDQAARDPGHLVVVLLKQPPTAGAVTALEAAIVGREVVRTSGRQAYVVYPDGIGRSRLTSAVIEKALGTRGTARNWNTVVKLAALANAP